jgi:PAS domain S-box-containing protein
LICQGKTRLAENPLNFQPLSPEELVTRLAAIVDSSEDAIIGTDVHGTINTWNTAAADLFGYVGEEILGQSILMLIPPDMYSEQFKNMDRLRAGDRVNHYETQGLRKGGDRVEISLAFSPIKDASEEFIGSAMIAREVSARREEEAVRSRLASIVESSDDAIIAKDLNGVVTDWNTAAERIFGFTAEEMIGRSILTIIPPELQHEEPKILQKIRAGERLEHHETQRLHKSGRRVEVSLTTSPVRDFSGRVVGASKIVREISERRKLEDAERLLVAIVESSHDAIVSKNLDGVIMSWNAAAERLFGYKAEEIVGQSVLRIIPPELHFEEPGIIAKLRSGERIEHHETRRRHKNGTIIDVSLTVSPIRNAKGVVIGGSKILRDIRDRKAAEELLIEREKLAAAGRLAATLAHEVNNPLESITNLAFLLTQSETMDAESRRFAEMLLSEVQRAGDITRQTLGFYRESKIRTDVDLRHVIDHVLHAKRKKLEQKNVKVEVEFRGVPAVKGFGGELRQVFDNLIENAIDAVSHEGRLTIRGREEGTPDSRRVSVIVSDDGPGIAREILPRIFEPFFTTKTEKGSGLGLWVSKSIVEKHGGTIHVQSSQSPASRETSFTVELSVMGITRPESPSSKALSLQSQRA